MLTLLMLSKWRSTRGHVLPLSSPLLLLIKQPFKRRKKVRKTLKGCKSIPDWGAKGRGCVLYSQQQGAEGVPSQPLGHRRDTAIFQHWALKVEHHFPHQGAECRKGQNGTPYKCRRMYDDRRCLIMTTKSNIGTNTQNRYWSCMTGTIAEVQGRKIYINSINI